MSQCKPKWTLSSPLFWRWWCNLVWLEGALPIPEEDRNEDKNSGFLNIHMTGKHFTLHQKMQIKFTEIKGNISIFQYAYFPSLGCFASILVLWPLEVKWELAFGQIFTGKMGFGSLGRRITNKKCDGKWGWAKFGLRNPLPPPHTPPPSSVLSCIIWQTYKRYDFFSFWSLFHKSACLDFSILQSS